MKNANYDNKLSMILDIEKRSGVVMAHLGEELGVDSSTIINWKAGRHLPDDPEEVIATLRSRAKFLSKIDLNKYDIKNLKKDFGLTIAALADEMEISHQGLSQQIEQDWPVESRKQEAQEILRAIGQNILDSSN